MAKQRAKKVYDEEEETLQKRSVNGVFEDKKDDELMGINAAMEQEKSSSESTTEEVEAAKLTVKLLLEEQQENAENRGCCCSNSLFSCLVLHSERRKIWTCAARGAKEGRDHPAI